MLYKVTPKLTSDADAAPAKEEKKVEAQGTEQTGAEPQPKVARKRRKALIYDAEGHEVLITMMCLKCKSMKPLAMFGLRKMADGAVRNQPWCRNCRSGASASKKKDQVIETPAEQGAEVQAAAPSAPSAPAEVKTQTDTPAVQVSDDAAAHI